MGTGPAQALHLLMSWLRSYIRLCVLSIVTVLFSINGFRRATDQGSEFSYGYAQAGDIIGSWIYEDIEAGFSALKWTKWTNRSVVAYEKRDATDGKWDDCINSWNASEWTSLGGYQQYGVIAEVWWYFVWGQGWQHYFSSHRYRIKDTLSFPSISIARSIDVYIAATPLPTYGFYDFDHWGVVSGQYVFYNSISAFSDATYTTGWIGSYDESPLELNPDIEFYDRASLSFFASPCYIAKWNFTHGENRVPLELIVETETEDGDVMGIT